MKNTPVHRLIEQAEELRLDASSIETVRSQIPRDRRKMKAILHKAIEGCHARAFTLLSVAALDAEIAVDAGILVHGTRLLTHVGYVAKLGVRLSGDVAGALVAAVEDGRLSWEREAAALHFAAWWGEERGVTLHNKVIVRRARMLARRPIEFEAQTMLVGAGRILNDPELDVLLSRLLAAQFPKLVERSAQGLVELVHEPLLSELDMDDDSLVVATRRRAAPRVGRNEPCPCGSGKKYKRCCFEKDQARLRDSSDIAGVTQAEMRRELEDFLTIGRLRALRPYELVRLDPKRIDSPLHRPLLHRLITFGEYDAVKEFFDAVGVEGLEAYCIDAIDKAVADSKPDKARALLEIYDPPEEAWTGFPRRLLKRKLDGGEALEILEEEARASVDDEAVTFAIDLLESQWPSLGILVARGVAAMATSWTREEIFEALGRARDRLDLPAVEPTEDMHDLWGWEEELDEELGGLTMLPPPSPPSETQRDDSAWHELEAKETELGRLREEMSELRAQLENHAHDEAVSSAEPTVIAQPAEGSHEPSETRVLELKERVTRLKGELNQRHAERNQLKRQLEREQKRADLLEAERQSSTDTTSEGQDEDEDELDAPELEASGPIPFRFPVLTKRFRTSLQRMPESTKRRTVILVSRIAAGDQAAFRGTRRLGVDRTLWRRRVGRDYRMLFRLTDEELEVLDIVPRQGFERAVRELT